MGINKVQYGNTVLIDLTDATATADKILQGYTAYGRDGSKLTGTATGGGSGDGYVWQDQDGYVHLSDEEGTQITVEALSVTQNGTYTAPTGTAYSPVTVNVSGGGGASNLVIGTFTGTTTGAAMDVTIPYAGTGYPLSVDIFPTGGYGGNVTYSELVQRYAIAECHIYKSYMGISPLYTGTVADGYDSAMVTTTYKNSTTSSISYGRGGSTTGVAYDDVNATSSLASCVKMRSATKMSVYIADTSYGFVANIPYTYHIIYSS